MGKEIKGIKGFKFAARAAGIKKPGKLDLALIYSEVPARCAGVFTANKVVAAPVVVTAPRIKGGTCQAVLVNSGNANACTGEQGLKDALRCGELAARVLGVSEDVVAVSSTGVIGAPLPMERLEKHVPLLAGMLEAGGAKGVAEAIMTTDSFAKLSDSRGSDYSILGLAKGAGMIHPDMATMLGFALTDARVEEKFLGEALRRCVDRSFNSITVDGDTSTNDMVLLLANGMAGGPEICGGTAAAEDFEKRLGAVLLDLAKMIVRDGEGATKLVTIQIRGAASAVQARQAARSVATSSLVKTAFFGEDANWGRIIAAVGYSGADVDPDRVDIRFGDVPVARQGLGTGKELEEQATRVLQQAEFTVTVDLNLGDGEAAYYTSDLTYDYIKINADYRT
ncbi:bifunctional glutamate N-acetyltransferase/amino-acid acetyltransferase ArgJ [uncultured Desulfuromonas sp.]|uniref:bifunctional glutamate N-acetyltransferase/amino-acid acetyltransferase ArgJ n=1 Tax=uncultured Desulfuromonas sp. TaxID=181013 RepID=UPI00263105A6|nr:bifunctional glutamate N-acetyltransferase/amino-acid acetyltransferase ArgJ [uncultured Desulfuromonas sp.]